MSSHFRRAVGKTRRPAPGMSSRQSDDLFAHLGRLADVVKRVYVLERRLQESSLTGHPSNYLPKDERYGWNTSPEVTRPRRSAWSRIASFLAKRRIGPIDYIARQFDQYRSLSMPLFPTSLLGEEAWWRYRHSKATKGEELAGRLRQYTTSLCSSAHSAGIDWPEISGRDTAVENRLAALYCDKTLPPLFVYCAAVLLGREHRAYADDTAKLVQRHEVHASVEYIRFRLEYEAVWQGLMPADFPARAEAHYLHVLNEVL